MIDIFTLELEANEAREFAKSGEYFEIRNASKDIELIELLDRSGGMVSRLKNPDQSDYVKPGRFETIRVTNGGKAQTCRFFVGSGDAGTRRVSGLVAVTSDRTTPIQIVDLRNQRSSLGEAFAAYILSVPPGGQFAAGQLWNPEGSGKNLVISQISVASGDYTMQLEIQNAKIPGGTLVPVKSKLTNGPLSIAEGYFAHPFSNPVIAPNIGILSMSTFRLTEPFVINPGYGFTFSMPVAGYSSSCMFEFYEEPLDE